jgi:farnesyl-diphosphate farnesyltransferase
MLELLSDIIEGTASGDAISNLTASFVSLQENASERKLLESLPHYLVCLERLQQPDRNEIRIVLEKITHGQKLDLQRFGNSPEILALDTAADLEEYTYLVAGSVGEFWTRLCFRHVCDFASRTDDEMLSLGKRYGKALQLINVVRDAGADLRSGRCYFPKTELAAVHLAASRILAEPERFQPIYRAWLEKAKAGLTSGMEYSRAIRNRRIRAATALPALIGARTLSLLEAAGPAALQRTVKLPRREVRTMVLSLAITLASRRRIDAMFGAA